MTGPADVAQSQAQSPQGSSGWRWPLWTAAGVTVLMLTGGLLLLAGDGPALWVVLWLLGGLVVLTTLGVVFWLAWMMDRMLVSQRAALGRLEEAALGLEQNAPLRLAGQGSSPPAAPAAAKDRPDQRLDEILRRLEAMEASLKHVLESWLLSPEQRELKRQRLAEGQIDELAQQAAATISTNDFEQAAALIDRLADSSPGDQRVAELTARLDQAREGLRQQELQDVQQHCGDFMAVGDYDRAAEAAEHLLARYPGSTQARELLEHVRREAQAFAAEHRRRLYKELGRLAEQRQWDAALDHARKLIEQYPDSIEGQTAAAQMATLRENSRLAAARELRDRMVDLLDRNRLSEAVDVAQRIIDEYPETQAASELREQIVRLRQRARGKGT